MDFPKTSPDNRKLEQVAADQESICSNQSDDDENSIQQKINQVLWNQVIEYRDKINKYKHNYITDVSSINIMMFGPTGSGKSSLIKSLYQSLHNIKQLPSEIKTKVKVNQKEGTNYYTWVQLKPNKKVVIDSGIKKYIIQTSAINLIDTRGQIIMNQHESQQLNLMIDGRVKNLNLVEQRKQRYAYLLWEFWKRDYDLYPENILQEKKLQTDPHCLIIVFDGSQEEVPNGQEEIAFYNDIIYQAGKKDYKQIQIILTCIDKVEVQIEKKYKHLNNIERETKLRDAIDFKIQSVVNNLQVSRSQVHFLENYHDNNKKINMVQINYNCLKLLLQCIKESENFIEIQNQKQSTQCLINQINCFNQISFYFQFNIIYFKYINFS